MPLNQLLEESTSCYRIGVEALFTRLGEEAVIGAVFASFYSFLS
jgi:hypothetical protein